MQMRINANYIIVDSIHAGDSEFVLGVHSEKPDTFVTWKCDRGSDYYWGHYHNDLVKAQKDLAERALEEIRLLEETERPSLFSEPEDIGKEDDPYER